jgi:hypothetical protein
MDKLVKVVGTAIMAAVLVAIGSVLSGTILWLVWPAAAQVFPAAIQAGYFVARLAWWQAVALIWTITIIFNRVTTVTKKE